MQVTVPFDCSPNDTLRLHFDCVAEVGEAEAYGSDERGDFGPKGCEVEIVSVTQTGIVLTDLPGLGNSEVQCVEDEAHPFRVSADCWLSYVDLWFHEHLDSWDEFQNSAIEAAAEEDAGQREAAAEAKHERWLESRGLS